ncbi:MAG: AtpZ/AtpI family protein [Candidatus Binatia bacterium]
MPKENPLFTYGKYGAIGFEFAGATIGGILLGRYIDSYFGSAPWGILLGAIAGLAGAVYRLTFVMQRLSSRRDLDNRKN